MPPQHGCVEQFTLTPRGDIDGLILTDGTEVKTPPHLSTQIAHAIKPGDVVTVHGLRAAALPLVQAASVTDDATGRTVVDNGPPRPGRGPVPALSAVGAAGGAGGAFSTTAALACNIMNNLPVGLIGGSIVAAASLPAQVAGALLIGVDLGPNLSITGSLATIRSCGSSPCAAKGSRCLPGSSCGLERRSRSPPLSWHWRLLTVGHVP